MSSTDSRVAKALQRVALAAVMPKTSKDQLMAAKMELAEAELHISSDTKNRCTVIDLCGEEEDSSITSYESKSNTKKDQHGCTNLKRAADSSVSIIDLTK